MFVASAPMRLGRFDSNIIRRSSLLPSSNPQVCYHAILPGLLRYLSISSILERTCESLQELITDHLSSLVAPLASCQSFDTMYRSTDLCEMYAICHFHRPRIRMTHVYSHGYGPIRHLQTHQIRRKVHNDAHSRCAAKSSISSFKRLLLMNMNR